MHLAASWFSELPDDFEYVLHLAVAENGEWDKDLGTNAESVGRCSWRPGTTTSLWALPGSALFDIQVGAVGIAIPVPPGPLQPIPVQ